MNTNITILPVRVTSFDQNCRILFDKKTSSAVVVDPGGEAEKIIKLLDKNNLKCEQIWITHSHLDHCGGVAALKAATSAKVYAHPDEVALRAEVEQDAGMFGIDGEGMVNCPEPDVAIKGGETLSLGDAKFQVIHAPGHTVGSLCFYNKEISSVIVGDVLFAGSIGRTDLPGGDTKTLMESIVRLIKTLPPETKVLPGHGPDTTILHEEQTNPFISGKIL